MNMSTLVAVLFFIPLAISLWSLIDIIRTNRSFRKHNQLSNEMDREFKTLSKAFLEGDMDKFHLHKERWYELHETWERDFKR